MQVILPVRSLGKGEGVIKQIQQDNASINGAGSLKVMDMDLNSGESVTNFVDQFKKAYKQLNILICNAGAIRAALASAELPIDVMHVLTCAACNCSITHRCHACLDMRRLGCAATQIMPCACETALHAAPM